MSYKPVHKNDKNSYILKSKNKMHSLYTGWPKKVSNSQIIKTLCYIVIKSANEIRFLRQIKDMIKHYNIICQY